MKKNPVFLLAAIAALAGPVHALAAESTDEAAHAVFVADMRGLGPIRAWWANLYNASPFQTAILTVVVVVLMGLVLSRLTDSLFNHIETKLRLKSRN